MVQAHLRGGQFYEAEQHKTQPAVRGLYLYRHRQAVFYTLQNHLDVHEAANVSQVALKLPNLCRPPLVQGYRFCLLRQYSADVV